MCILNCTSGLIFFAYWDWRRLPAVGREDRNAQISIWYQLYSCLFCLMAKYRVIKKFYMCIRLNALIKESLGRWKPNFEDKR